MTHSDIDQFLATAVPLQLGKAAAEALAKHLAECEVCAAKLHECDGHRDVLLNELGKHGDALIPNEWKPSHDGLRETQRELRQITDTVLREASPSLLQQLAEQKALSPEELAEFPVPPEAGTSHSVLRTTLAVAEACLTLESLVLGSPRERVALFADGAVMRDRERIPPRYVAAAIGRRSHTPSAIAQELWSLIARSTVLGRVGLPGLADVGRIKEEVPGVELAVVDD
jgi:hypothetical protein